MEARFPEKINADHKSIRLVSVQASAGINTKLGAFFMLAIVLYICI